MQALALVLALAVVTLGAELLVRGASLLALRAGVSSLFVGLTVVGFGTSTPELGASLFATLEGSAGVAVGNVVGSNIFNIGVILGTTALLIPIRVELRTVRRDLLIALAASGAPLLALALGGVLPRTAGAILAGCLGLYLVVAFRAARRAGAEEEERASAEVRSTLAVSPTPRLIDAPWVNALFVVAGLACLVFGSRRFVDEAITIASEMGLSERIIGLTIVSIGTSLPELLTSLVAIKRRNPDIAIGNVIGSNVFNVLGILGVCAIVRPQEVTPVMLGLDVPVMLLMTAALLPIVRTGGVISRAEGGVLLVGYGAYLGWLLRG